MPESIANISVFLFAVAYVIIYVAKQIRLRRLIARLKQVDVVLWVAMGEPQATYFSRFRDYTTSRPINLPVAPPTEYSELSIWLSQRCYLRINDVELTANAERYRKMGSVQFAAAIVAICAYLVLRFVAHR